MRSYAEIIDDAETLAKVFTTYKAKTTRDSLIMVTEAEHILQKKTKAVKRDITFLTSAFDASGSLDFAAAHIGRDIGEVSAAYYYPAGSLVPCKAFVVGYPQIQSMNRQGLQTNGIWPLVNFEHKIAVAVHNNRLWTYPNTPGALNGSLTITYCPKLAKYSIESGLLGDGRWAGWEASLDTNIEAYGPEPEFDFAEEAMAFYVAAQYLDKMPAARMTYEHKYQEWMGRFAASFEDVIYADSPYNIQQGPHGYTGPAQHR